MQTNEHIVEATASNFTGLVLARSREIPVVVDFWAGWCAPCQVLMPLLHKLAGEYQGGFLLATVDTDQEQQLALQYGVRSLPTVKVFRHGEVVDEFMGALPESALREFIERHIEKPADKLVGNARLAMESGNLDEARRLLDEALAMDPGNLQATLTLARLLLRTGEAHQAQTVLDALPFDKREETEVRTLAAQARFAREAQEAPPAGELEKRLAADPGDLQARYQLGVHKLTEGDYDGAMDQFLELMRRDRAFGDDLGRRSLLTVFEILGEGDERVNRYRRQMARLLY